jgi:uncharacterized protein YggE
MSRTIGVVAILFVALLGAVIAVIELVRIPQMYSVEGNGRVTYRPDAAEISVGVAAKAEIANDASLQVSETMTRVLNALKAAGVEPKDITTDTLQQRPITRDRDEPSVAKGYAAYQSIDVDVRDLARLPSVIGVLSAAGANDWTVNFYATDRSGIEQLAKKAALKDAIEKADMYAAEGQFKRGRVLKIVDSAVAFPSANYTYRDFEDFEIDVRRGRRGDDIQNTPVAVTALESPKFEIPQPEEQAVTAKVDVLFALD